MKIAVIAPVLNEVDFIGYSIMAAMPGIHSFHYGIDAKSSDGTLDLVKMIASTSGKDKVFWYKAPDFNIDPMNMKEYNGAFNALIECARSVGSESVMFLHPDMIMLNSETILSLEDGPLAWFTNITSYAGDFKTVISKERCPRWKNIHALRFGLQYYGGYGSANEDFYHKDITGNSYKFYGDEFSKYPFRVADSGLRINHYCELKDYTRRLEKMKLCLTTQHPDYSKGRIEELAVHHPRVTLEPSSRQFGDFEFTESKEEVPSVFETYKETFDQFKKGAFHGEPVLR